MKDQRSPLYRADPEQVVVRNGRLSLRTQPNLAETYQQLLARNNRPFLEARGQLAPEQGAPRYSSSAHRGAGTTITVLLPAAGGHPGTPPE